MSGVAGEAAGEHAAAVFGAGVAARCCSLCIGDTKKKKGSAWGRKRRRGKEKGNKKEKGIMAISSFFPIKRSYFAK
jgi:hypothetical protein